MTIIVTGAAGFIGSNICSTMLRSSDNSVIIGIDNYNPYYSSAIKKRRITELSKHKRFVFVQSSFDNIRTLARIRSKFKPTILVHTASEVGVRNGENNPLTYVKTNVMGTATLLETIGNYVHHIVLLSSSSVYGNSSLPFSENNSLHPTSVYGTTKACMESYAVNYYARYGTPTTIIRPFSVYGPDGRPDMLPMKLLMASALGRPIIVSGRETKRDWTYIDDVASAIALVTNQPNHLQRVNIGFGEPLSNAHVLRKASAIIKTFGYHLEYSFSKQNPIEAITTWADTTRLREKYDVKIITPFELGFQQTARFFFSHLNLYAKID